MEYTYLDHEIYKMKDEHNYLLHVTFPLLETGVVNINHTFVDVSLRGQGVASTMMHETMKFLQSKDLKVVATCPYAVVWLKKHKEYQAMIRQDLMDQLGTECVI
ncbi:MAG: GNAT family N-acetyltransferase [Acholeplasmataceae bacterium]|jgi:predicted GNAT family acetyltransferase